MTVKSTPEIEQRMFEVLEPLLKQYIRGGFYPSDCRPADSHAEDGVLIVSTANASQIQEGRAKLNIYIPDIDCGVGRAVPDKGRIQALAALDNALVDALNEADTDYDFFLSDATHSLGEPDMEEHFVNINIGFRLITF